MNYVNQAPGVYIKEVDQPGPIAGVSTSVAAIVGPALNGPINTPTLITNWTQFVQNFSDEEGEVYARSPHLIYTPNAVRGFFDNGGAMCYFTRVSTAAHAQLTLQDASGGDVLTIKARQEGAAGNEIRVKVSAAQKVKDRVITSIEEQDRRQIQVADLSNLEPGSYVQITTDNGNVTFRSVVTRIRELSSAIDLDKPLPANVVLPAKISTLEFTLEITKPRSKKYEFLSLDTRHSRFFGKAVDSEHIVVNWADPLGMTQPPDNLPAAKTATSLAGGADNNLDLGITHYQAALDALKGVEEVNMVCVPDNQSVDVQKAIISHCETMHDRFAILDPSSEMPVEQQRNNLGSDTGFAALYFPHIYVADPFGGEPVKAPPSGHIAGLYARTDNNRGVHKAPANESLRGVLGLENVLTDNEQGPLNEKGINVLRFFPGRGVVVWGARTIAPGDRTQWRYVNIRRLLLYIEESIREGTRFAVFEPNNQALWQTVQRRVGEFLNRVWRAGALYGSTPDEAYRVRVDEELNPASLRALGQLVIEVVVYPVTPAEFVEFRVIQQPGGPSVEERS